MRGQTRTGICAVLHESTDDKPVVMVEGVCGVVGIILLLIVSPAVVAEFVPKVLGHGNRDIKVGLPVDVGISVGFWNRHWAVERWDRALGRVRLGKCNMRRLRLG